MEQFLITLPHRYPGNAPLSEMSWYRRDAETAELAAKIVRLEGRTEGNEPVDVYRQKPNSQIFEFVARFQVS